MIGQVEKSEKDEQAKANLCYPFDLSITHNEPAPPINVGCHSKYVIITWFSNMQWWRTRYGLVEPAPYLV
jgi:hypothetical protein